MVKYKVNDLIEQRDMFMSDLITVPIINEDMIAECLDRQIPVRPMRVDEHYRCPTCLDTVGHTDRHYPFTKRKHCNGCGQLINWAGIDDRI